MAVVIKKGNLFSYQGNTKHVACIGHGVNSAGAMGAGIAIEFKNRFPEMYVEYKKRCQNGLIFPGITWVWQEIGAASFRYNKQGILTETSEETFVVYNLAIKAHWKLNATYEAVEASLINMATDMNEHNFTEIALPWIGCGYGGLQKAEVQKILEKVAAKHNIDIIVYEV
jgi:O-acetyl-ADP-ribose deacetylase (regulator of RNase III)